MIVNLYLFPIPLDFDTYRMAYQLLSPSEQAVCARLLSHGARQAHAVGRAVVRLAGSGGDLTSALDWPISEQPGGKPYCPLPGALQFNLSHTGHGDEAYGLLAVATAAVGVDLEVARPVENLPGIAAIVLNEQERATLLTVPAAEQSSLFLRLWTLKESILKATGTGFRSDPRKIDFGELTAAPLENVVAYSVDGRPWFCTEIFVAKQLVAALCSEVPAKLIVSKLSTQQLHRWLAVAWRHPSRSSDKKFDENLCQI